MWYSDEGPERAAAPPISLIAVPNVTVHPSTASVPVTVLLYNAPLLCDFNVPIKVFSSMFLKVLISKRNQVGRAGLRIWR